LHPSSLNPSSLHPVSAYPPPEYLGTPSSDLHRYSRSCARVISAGERVRIAIRGMETKAEKKLLHSTYLFRGSQSRKSSSAEIAASDTRPSQLPNPEDRSGTAASLAKRQAQFRGNSGSLWLAAKVCSVSTLRQAPSLQLKKTPCLLSAPRSAKPPTPHIRHISHHSPLSDHHNPFILSDRGILLSSISHLSAVDPATMTVDPATLFIPISINLSDRGNSAWSQSISISH
jgi:hypothetical protein